MVEFALVLPILLVLFVAIADFGRIFANSILLEAASRNGAELAANEYVSSPPGGTPLSAPSTGDITYYTNLHLLAARAICVETQELPNSQYQAGTTNCPGMPVIKVCVHDGVDPICGTEAFSATVPTQCNEMQGGMTNAQESSERWVEVRVCYRFTSLVDAPLLSLGEFWLQRTRTFGIPCYFVIDTAPCG
jgi:hypothetical protein